MHGKNDSKNQGCSGAFGGIMVVRFIPVSVGMAKAAKVGKAIIFNLGGAY
jgi:hypothetical protein